MAGKTIGKAFRVSKKDVRGYGYAQPKGRQMKSNPGVTAIAAINGRGAHAKAHGRRSRSARQAMAGLSRKERLRRARSTVTGADRDAFAKRKKSAKQAKGAKMRTNASPKQIAAARRNIRKAIAARRRKAGGTSRRKTTTRRKTTAKKRPMKRNATRRKTTGRSRQTPAQRRASLKNLRKARAAKKRPMRKNAKRTKRKSTKRASSTARRRASTRSGLRKNPSRGRQTAAQRRASLKNLRKARAATKRKSLKRNPSRRRKTTKRKSTARRRKSTMRRNSGRQTAAQRRASLKNLRKARAAQKRGGGKRKATRRRTHRRNAWYGQPRRHSKAAKKGWKGRKKMRRNASVSRSRYTGNAKAFRKNQYMATLRAAFANGALVTAGFAAHKGLTKVVCRLVCDKLFGAPVTAATPAEAPAVSGLEALQPYRNVIAGGLTAALGIGAANMVLRDVRTKMMVTSGMAASFLHTVLIHVLDRVSPEAAAALSGAEDAEAARLSAMYGLGAGTSILPHYAPIGMGEYFTEGVSGLGEYFTEHMSGLGAYGANPDLYQAAAGYGAVNNENSNHIDPTSDLDRELSIAEAAAGVGQAYQAAAGFGEVEPFEASAGMGRGVGEYFTEGVQGLGNIATLPTADTWVPGTSDGQLWAGVRAVNQPQPTHAMTRAGILTSGGNQGVFG